MPDEALLDPTRNDALNDLIGCMILLVAADELDLAMLLIGGEDGEVLQDIEHDLGPEHATHCAAHLQQSTDLTLRNHILAFAQSPSPDFFLLAKSHVGSDAAQTTTRMLSLLRETGVEARGIDADADMVAYARGEGLDVEQADLVEYLERLEDRSLGGIFMGQVVEHLPPVVLVRALELAAQKLGPGGVLVAETINPLSPLALRHYFADLTHAQPLVPETLQLLARQSGFAETEVRYLNEPAERLTEPDDPVIAANVRRLNELLFAPLDYALVARTADA